MDRPRRRMRRLGDVLPDVASGLGIEEELRRSRQMAAWERLVAELVPGASGSSTLLAVQPPALVVSAASQIVAQELRLRSPELLRAFAGTPEGVRLIELRVTLRRPGDTTRERPENGPRGRPDPRVD